jgi:hypothetical protein
MKVMSDIQHHHGNPYIGLIVTALLYILARITVNEVALFLTCISATVVILANLPKAINTIKQLINKKK